VFTFVYRWVCKGPVGFDAGVSQAAFPRTQYIRPDSPVPETTGGEKGQKKQPTVIIGALEKKVKYIAVRTGQ
jgi:hypothetical protein